MEITWLGLFFLIVAWISSWVSTGLSLYLYTKNKDYNMNNTDKGYLLGASITAVITLAFVTIVTMMIMFLGRNRFRENATIINRLMSEKLDLENKLNDVKMNSGDVSSIRKNILENPIPIRRGRSARPLIV
jgi:hypothetical protein